MNKLGIDIGYSTFKYIYLDNKDNIIEKGYIFHKGNIEKYYNEYLTQGHVSYNGWAEKVDQYSQREMAKKFAKLMDKFVEH